MELKNIAILGPGGNVGSAIINELSRDGPRFNITAITRQTSTYTPPEASDITHKTADYTSLSSLTEAFTGHDAIVNCITGGATQYDSSKLIIDAAVAAGVKFFFANEFVGYVDSPQFHRMPEAFTGAKIRIREYLGELAATGKITWTSLNGGPFFDMWLMKGPAGFDVANRRARIYGTGENSLFWTPLPVIARAAGNILKRPNVVANRPIYICPFAKGELTQRSLLTTLQDVLDAEFAIEEVDLVKINKNARIALERGEAGKAMKGLVVSNQFYEEDSGNDFSHLIQNAVVGVDLMSVEEAVRDAIARWGQDCPIVESMFRVEACEI
ncbi:NAD(P)-binding protein [Macroventuria anomochaeta]|uniref:NAD(P)-binding protein n=1 Tax=Macroventuria anomochaeta TaxID=301207 RepID=A0ACB6RVF8_9PLEO|nr:NAD(P)-binding protein [Macroventuria anomochaeta]KAF2625773.1 NAD(P)-binding protein [Macroventuria anomochaeta]